MFIVQLDGDEQWEVRGPSRVTPMFRVTDPTWSRRKRASDRGALRADDALRIPAGADVGPSGSAGAGHSLHVTFGLHQRTGADLLIWLADQKVRQYEQFRTGLPLAGSNGETGRADAFVAVATELGLAGMVVIGVL
ncbi:cupin domain-containing protein [Actinopolyspora biskrensis]|uniref:cupin domain-containing protein n=1 Tax=Actinopolyspora biskrensis TaxID=1470178 RepID=UPI0015C8CCD1